MIWLEIIMLLVRDKAYNLKLSKLIKRVQFHMHPLFFLGQRYLKNALAGSEFPATVVSYGSDGKFLFYYGDIEDSIVEIVNFHEKNM